jgi:GntR family transcriptional regulator
MVEPMYRQIADDLRSKIESGEVAPGAQLPTEVELMSQYRASRNTVRDAIKLLATRGLLETRPGQGTFAIEKFELLINRIGGEPENGLGGEGALYLPEMPSGQRLEASDPRVEIQSVTHSMIANELLLPEHSQVVCRHQQRFVDSIPWSLQTSFYPMQLVQMGATRLLTAEDLWPGAVQYIQEALGIKQVGWNERLAVRAPDELENEFFRLPLDGRIPIIESIRTGYDESGRPLRATVTVYPADRNQFSLTVGRVPPPVGWAGEVPDTAKARMAEVRAAAVVALER